ncbi:MAG TPA: hypothetical protein PLU39_10320 [Armatimonadota bacterium]|nr:hypothetical protein [Armatimonadota bacterium]
MMPVASVAVALTLSIGARALLAFEPDDAGQPEISPPETQTEYLPSPESGEGRPWWQTAPEAPPDHSLPDSTGRVQEWQPSPYPEEPGFGHGWPDRRPYRPRRERVRRAPAPIPPGRDLPYYPPEPPPSAPPSSAVSAPPDFIGSATGILEIPVGQTATLFVSDYQEATTREERIACVVARESDRVLIRGRFPGRTLLEVRQGARRDIYLVRVR